MTTNDVRAAADVRIRGRDGRLYRLHQLTARERARAIVLAHWYVHREHVSIRVAQRIMAEQHGVRRSTGAISTDLANYVCDACRDDTPRNGPEHPAAPATHESGTTHITHESRA